MGIGDFSHRSSHLAAKNRYFVHAAGIDNGRPTTGRCFGIGVGLVSRWFSILFVIRCNFCCFEAGIWLLHNVAGCRLALGLAIHNCRLGVYWYSQLASASHLSGCAPLWMSVYKPGPSYLKAIIPRQNVRTKRVQKEQTAPKWHE